MAAQAAEGLIHLAPAGTAVRVNAVQPGTAPCDWDHGFTDPTDDESHDFANILRQVRPEVVAFVFTGNPGLDGPKGGCVDANSPYTLSQLLARYEPPLVDMADRAARIGATVYFEAPPPRNPAVPVGYDSQHQGHRGFQGSPAMASFYERLVATRNPRHWRYDDTAAVDLSAETLSWRLTLPCQAWDTKLCTMDRFKSGLVAKMQSTSANWDAGRSASPSVSKSAPCTQLVAQRPRLPTLRSWPMLSISTGAVNSSSTWSRRRDGGVR